MGKLPFKSRAKLSSVVAVLLYLALGGASLPAQAPTAMASDDPEIYFGYFYLIKAISTDILATADSERAKLFTQGAASTFGVSVEDFAATVAACRAATSQLDALNARARQYVREQKGAADISVLRQFSAERLAIVQSGIRALQAAVSGQGWAALHAYINGPYRAGIARKEAPIAKP